MATIEDIARLSGVSRGTVSRVLNGGSVSKESKEAIERVIADVGYRPSKAARDLRLQKSNLIGLIVPSFGGFFGEVMKAMQDNIEADNKTLITIEGRNAEHEKIAFNRMLDMNCEGIVFDSRYLTDDEILDLLKSTKTPVILLNRLIHSIKEQCLDFDHFGSAANLTIELIHAGHTNIACIAGDRNYRNSNERARGYKFAMDSFNLKARIYRGAESGYTKKNGQFAAELILSCTSKEPKPTALMCCSEELAAGALQACYNLDLKLPNDIEIATFDSYGLCEMLNSNIRSVEFPIVSMAIKSIEKLKKAN